LAGAAGGVVSYGLDALLDQLQQSDHGDIARSWAAPNGNVSTANALSRWL